MSISGSLNFITSPNRREYRTSFHGTAIHHQHGQHGINIIIFVVSLRRLVVMGPPYMGG
jgi:hypothetical protein